MAVNRVPVLKRCRSLGLDPVYLEKNRKQNLSMVFWKNRSGITIRKQIRCRV